MTKKQEQIKVEVGYESVIIDKLFGPQIFMNLRITADLSTNEWIIERQTTLPCPDPEMKDTLDWIKWVVWCRIPGQFEWEFMQRERDKITTT